MWRTLVPTASLPLVRSRTVILSQRFYAKRNINFDDIPIERIRNIGVIAHVDAGKTTTAERMLFLAGTIRRMGDVHTGDTTMDFLEMERDRGITIQSACISFLWNTERINMIDTPGHVDFQGEVERSVRVLDGVVTVLDSTKGVQAQTHSVWRQAERYQVPRIVFANKMDQDDGSISRVCESLATKLGCTNAIQLQIAVGTAEKFRGVIDIIEKKQIMWGVDEIEPVSIEDVKEDNKLYSQMMDAREKLCSKLAENDDDLVEAYLEHEANVPADLIHKSVRKNTINMKITPVICGSSLNKIGIQPLLNGISRYLPSPLERPPIYADEYIPKNKQFSGQQTLVSPDPKGPLHMLAFKVIHDKQRGMIVYGRVYSGTLSVGGRIMNAKRETEERVLTLMRIGADEMTNIQHISSGDICALVGLKSVYTGDTLVGLAPGGAQKKKAPGLPVLKGVHISPPVFTCAVEANEEKHEKKLIECLECLVREDPTVHFHTDPDSGQLLISGMGELHMEVIKDRLLNHYNVDAWIGKMQISYRTTVADVVQKRHLFVYQLTGDRQSAEVEIRVEPLFSAEEIEANKNASIMNEILFELPDEVLENTPPAFLSDIKHNIIEGIELVLSCGPLYNFPMNFLRITVTDINHFSDSTAGTFRGCATRVMRELLKESTVEILQPMMKVEIDVTPEYFGPVLTDISTIRKGNVISAEDNVGGKVILAEVPLQYLLGYSTVLRSHTKGTASFTMEFDHYGTLTGSEVNTLHAEFQGTSRKK